FSEGDTLRLKGIVVNSHRPLQFSLLRLLLMLIIPALAYLLRRGSRFRQEELSYPCRRADLAALILGLILLLPSVVLTVANENAWENEYFRPYQQLSEAFAAGQLSLVETPPAALAELENPYDFTARTAAGLQMDTDYLWDTAWYRGKYYVYFGVIPCLLFYFPYYLLLGKHLSDAAMVIFCAVFCYSGIWLCLREYLIRKEKKLPAGVPLILTALVYLGSGMMTDLGAPNAHNIPRDLGLVLILWGLFLWQRSLSAGGKKRGALLAAGSLLMALAVGCRPNLALYSFLALPLFYKAWKEAGGLRKKEGLSLLGELLLPYVPVALGLMIYNALRFGSPFDFGMSYNLTVRDYSHNNVFSDRIAVGIWEYLFRPAQTEPQFPFLGDVGFAKLNPLGQGSFYYTAGYGGLFACNILMFFLPGLCTGNKKNGEGLWLLGLSFVNMIANICLGGVAYHYRVDFAAEMLLAAAIGALEIHGECGKKGKEVTESILLLALALSWLYHIRFAWTGGLAEGNTELYYRLFYAMRI
ncbi:MAG: hypothetical protein IK115_00020, partial [Lachnospiraceae bacterium]|nr:hypothetical protein [Lachnospiraceae bacterium]